MVNTWNAAELNEKVNNLNAKVDKIGAKTLPDTSEATTGQVLGLTGEDKTPDWVDNLPDASEATTGQVLGLTGESKTPGWVDVTGGVNYSTDEQDSGLKWIDGSTIYQKTYTGTAAGDVLLESNYPNKLIDAKGFVQTSTKGVLYGGTGYATNWKLALQIINGDLYILCGSELAGGTYGVTLFYTKPEEAKTTKKKTTK